MRLDPKHFNIFIGTLGVFAIILIGYFTVTYYAGQQAEFKEKVGEGEEIRTIVFEDLETGEEFSIDEYQNRPVVLDFWAPWSGRSMQAHEQLSELRQSHPDLVILSVLVKDDENSFREYQGEHNYDFRFAQGTEVYEDFLVPGVPSYVIFGRDGIVFDVIVGYRSPEVFDNLVDYLESAEQ